jgi:hypothetical protein
MDQMISTNNKPTLLSIGLIVLLVSVLLRILLQNINASPILVDLARLGFFAGLGIIVFGFIARRKKSL